MYRVSCLCLRDEARKWSLRLFSIEQLETNRVLRSLSAIQRRKAIRKMFSELTKNDLDVLASRAVLYQQRVESGNPHPLDHEAMREIKRKEKLQSRAQLIDYDISVTNIKNNPKNVSVNNENDTELDKQTENATNNSSSTSLVSSASPAQEADTTAMMNELSKKSSISADANKREMHKKSTSDKKGDDVLTPEMIKEVTPFEFFVMEQKSNPSMAAITSEEERMTKLKEIFDTLPDTAREVIAKNAHEHAIKMARRRLAAAKARRASKELAQSSSKGKKARNTLSKGKKNKKDKKKKRKSKGKKVASSEAKKSNNNNNNSAGSSESYTELEQHQQPLNKCTDTNSGINDEGKCNEETTSDANLKLKDEKKPRKPSNYTLFVKEQMLSVKHLPNKERLVEISKRWKALSDNDRLNWKPEHTADNINSSETPEITDSKSEVVNAQISSSSSIPEQIVKEESIDKSPNNEKESTETKNNSKDSLNQYCSSDSENANVVSPDASKDKQGNVDNSAISKSSESLPLPTESAESSTTSAPATKTTSLSSTSSSAGIDEKNVTKDM